MEIGGGGGRGVGYQAAGWLQASRWAGRPSLWEWGPSAPRKTLPSIVCVRILCASITHPPPHDSTRYGGDVMRADGHSPLPPIGVN